MNRSPLAVATEPPMLYAPVSLNPSFSSDSTRPNGILHATSPVFTLIANNSPHGGGWQGHPVAGLTMFPALLRLNGTPGVSPPLPFCAPGVGAAMRVTSPRSCELMKKYPSLGSKLPPPQLNPPSGPGNTTVLVMRTGANGPSFCAPLKRSSQYLRCSGVNDAISSGFQVMRASGGGFSGNGWVGEYHSPGTSPFATGRSSMP